MATRILNKEMEFFYNGEDSFEKMIEEFNNRFSFQKVIFLTEDKTFQDLIFEHRKTIQFFPVYKQNLNNLEQDISCVVQCDSENMISNRKACFENEIFFVVCITSYIDITNFSDSLLFDDFSQRNCEKNRKTECPVLGVFVLNLLLKNNFENFKICLLYNMLEMCFFAIESKMDNLYFSSENNHFDLIIKEFYAFLQEYKINENNYQNYLDLYFQMIDIKRTLKVDLLENLSQFDDELYCKPNDNDKYELKYNLKCGLNDNLKDDLKNIYKRSIISEVLLNIYQTFLKKISPQIVSIMNSNNVMFFENYFDFKTRYDESKFWFVNSKCRYDFIADINDLLDIIFNIKKIIQSVNINTTYLLAKSVDTSKIKSQLKTLAFSFKSDSLLKIIASYGFLDFD